MYASTLVSEFLAPYHLHTRHTDFIFAPPQQVHLFHEGRFVGPFVYGLVQSLNMETLQREYAEDTTRVYPLRFLCSRRHLQVLGPVRGLVPPGLPGEGGTLFLPAPIASGATCSPA